MMIVPGSVFMVGGGGESDPYWDNVILLMHFDNDWTDYSTQNHTPSNSGAGFVAGKFDFAGQANNSGYVTVSSSTFEMTSPDNTATAFTVEFWVYVSTPTDTSSLPLIAAKRGADDINVWYIDLSWGKLRYFADTSGGAIGDTLADDLPSAAWTHVAWSRSPSSAGDFNKIFVNGVEKYSTGGGTWWFDNVTLLEIFRRRDGISNLVAAKGSIEDLRITRGVARYTTDFTPPTAPFPNQ